MNVAVVLAGGTGSRFGSAVPKQFLDLEGKMVIEHSIDLFESIDAIDETMVVVHADYDDIMRHTAERRGWRKLRHIVRGGAERYHSSLNAIRQLDAYDGATNVILHDAARPWVERATVEAVVEALSIYEAAAVGIPSTDTVWQIAVGGEPTISSIPPRASMWRAQTPQAFRLSLLREAYERALSDTSFAATDDCGTVRRYCPEVPIRVIEGSERNRKITFSDDL